jgi:hypothetical protein
MISDAAKMNGMMKEASLNRLFSRAVFSAGQRIESLAFGFATRVTARSPNPAL